METISYSLSSFMLPPLNLSSSKLKQYYQPGFRPGRRSRGLTMAARRDHRCEWNYGGRSVDESMVILRKRIHEMKMIERNYTPPEDWMEWEKHCYGSYDENVCFFAGLLQSFLMDTRPSIALGMVALMVMSVPVSAVVIISRVLVGANAVISALHWLFLCE